MPHFDLKHLCVLFEAISLLAAIIFFFKTRSRLLAGFILLFSLTNLVEWGNLFNWYTIHFSNGLRSNNWTFNLLNPLEFGFFAWVYYSLVTREGDKNKIKYIYFILLLLVSIDMLFIQGIIYFDSYTFMIGCLFMLYCVYLYFKQSLEKIDNQNIIKSNLFWISIGLLFFYTGWFFLMAFFEYFLHIHDFSSFAPIFHFFSNFLNIILYSCLTTSFFWTTKQQNISTSES